LIQTFINAQQNGDLVAYKQIFALDRLLEIQLKILEFFLWKAKKYLHAFKIKK